MKECSQEHYTIKEFPEEERPREKLIKYGEKNLSDAELLAILLRTGGKNMTAISLAHQILNHNKIGLRHFIDAPIEELRKIKGIGIAKSAQLKAAIELGRRLSREDPINRNIKSPLDVVDYLMEEMRYLSQEHFKVVLLNTKNFVISIDTVTIGTVNASLVHPREVFKNAIKKSCTSIILVHNHPSGDPYPSVEDKSITKRLIEAGNIIGIKVLDHIIIGDGKYLSFNEKGMI
ncbi:DNA repair protein RadC [Irregularibacter muris]|uniref:DNA repair protein RadC n=1 Tax=Irregularibacter muris TaxID=1796619 RepID=A0AAE3HJA8_9FIRM|nr:DNA repair protein RadC [Irregularibacter muris]MCR1899899.1 DNA repair protein RadC [Irregularibacter muris]